MSDIVERLRATLLDRDNFPRMDSEKWLPVGLAKEAADEIKSARRVCDSYAAENQRFHDEIERLRAENKRLQAALIEAAEMVTEK